MYVCTGANDNGIDGAVSNTKQNSRVEYFVENVYFNNDCGYEKKTNFYVYMIFCVYWCFFWWSCKIFLLEETPSIVLLTVYRSKPNLRIAKFPNYKIIPGMLHLHLRVRLPQLI